MASERTDELYKVLLDRGYPKGFETKRVMKINFEQPIPQEVGELLCLAVGASWYYVRQPRAPMLATNSMDAVASRSVGISGTCSYRGYYNE